MGHFMRTKFLLSVFFIIFSVVSSYAEDQDVTLPKQVETRTGHLIRIDAKTTSKEVIWIKPPNNDVEFVPVASENSLLIVVSQPGTYRIIAVTAKGDKAFYATCDLVVTGPPTPPAPPPAPHHESKTAPEVKPVVPEAPTDPLTAVLQVGYNLDKDSDKAVIKTTLIELYTQANQLALDPKITTWDQWMRVERTAENSLFHGLADSDVKMLNTRKILQAEMLKLIPDKTTVFDRAKAASFALQFAKALEGVK